MFWCSGVQVGSCFGWLVFWLVGWLVGVFLVGWCFGWLVFFWLVGVFLVGWLVGVFLVGWCFGWLVFFWLVGVFFGWLVLVGCPGRWGVPWGFLIKSGWAENYFFYNKVVFDEKWFF